MSVSPSAGMCLLLGCCCVGCGGQSIAGWLAECVLVFVMRVVGL